jgi:hypothetical protein
MGIIPAIAILTISMVQLRAFCHFAPAQVMATGFSAKMAILGKTGFTLSHIINEL